MQNKKEYSQKTSKQIDSQIISIANKCINDAIYLLTDKVPLMDILVDELVEKETLEADYVINKLKSFQSNK